MNRFTPNAQVENHISRSDNCTLYFFDFSLQMDHFTMDWT